MMRKPEIGEAVLRRHGGGPLAGPIDPGEVFAWAPDLPHARELCIVRRVFVERGEPWVETWNMDYTESHLNEESCFREVCVRTIYNRFPAEKPPMVLSPLPDGAGIFELKRAS